MQLAAGWSGTGGQHLVDDAVGVGLVGGHVVVALGVVHHFLVGLAGAVGQELKFDLPELSMGMTHDLEIAVEEGATWVRVGTAIFGPRPCALRPLEET